MNGLGRSPWAEAWVMLMEANAGEREVAAGFTYAREGLVDISSIEPGHIRAVLAQGRFGNFVTITCPLPDPAVFGLRNLGFEVLAQLWSAAPAPAAMAAVLEGLPRLLPRWEELDLTCTCAGREGPCEHTVAAWYAVGEKMAEWPHSLLVFRGVERPEVFDAAMECIATRTTGCSQALMERLSPAAGGRGTTSLPSPLMVDAEAFWQGNPAGLPASFAIEGIAPRAPGWVLRPPLPWPAAGDRPSYSEIMVRAYDLLRAGANRALSGEQSRASTTEHRVVEQQTLDLFA